MRHLLFLVTGLIKMLLIIVPIAVMFYISQNDELAKIALKVVSGILLLILFYVVGEDHWNGRGA